ncbi:Tyrosine recombinase XerD [Nocardia cerradoensis]|uniref:Tyrosine recombinase XerD n=1 Tax=Nocardia cerradoensis TaxID=85688 RepID=A0A231H6F2_9NOCA|nr:site-specific integrase [Nocardia cerradoensis]OXR44370.1 Tyrosine recombinase XerD [Nocardia cerradoensis]
MSTPENISRKPRRKPGNVRIEDRHYIDGDRSRPTSRWKTDANGKRVPIGKRYIVHWNDPTGTPKSKSFDKRGQAEDHKTKMVTEIHEGTYRDPHKVGTPFSVIADLWVKSLASAPKSTASAHKSVLKNHVRPTFDPREIGSITKTDIVSWVAELTDKGLSPATVHRCFVALRGVLTLAIPDHLRADPSAGVKLPPLPSAKDRFLTHTEVALLAAAADYRAGTKRPGARTDVKGETGGPLPVDKKGVPIVPAADPSPDGLAIRFLAYTGLRVGELSGLQVSDVDLKKGRVRVDGSLAVDEDEPGDTKSRKTRWVPIPKSMHAELRKHLKGRKADDWAFTAPGGGPIRRTNWNRRVLKPAAELVGLLPLTAHDLRHTYASLSASSGVRVEVVSKLMGHADPGFTMRRYIGLFPDDMSASADLLDAAMSAGK